MEPDLALVTTDRLVLRKPTSADLTAAVAVHTDPAANRYNQHGVRPADEARELIPEWLQEWRSNGIGYWTVTLPGGRIIGFGGIRHAVENGENVLNLYYRFLPSSWGNGYATEMCAAALRAAEQVDPALPVSIVTSLDNAASLALAEKLGFAEYGRRVTGAFEEVLLRR
jgi:RimJ/RimL family protein N-acetyltransferase